MNALKANSQSALEQTPPAVTWAELIDQLLEIRKANNYRSDWLVRQVKAVGMPPIEHWRRLMVELNQHFYWPELMLNCEEQTNLPDISKLTEDLMDIALAPAKKKNINLIAIDPGVNGGIAIYFNSEVTAYPMPTDGKVSNLVALAQLIRLNPPDLAIIGKPCSKISQNKYISYKAGEECGKLQGLLTVLGIPYELATAHLWRKAVLGSTAKDKRLVRMYCKVKFPNISLTISSGISSHIGMANALCLMQFGIRNHAKQLSIN
jgi:crossover junction endodeoxyribonuclease RuvC